VFVCGGTRHNLIDRSARVSQTQLAVDLRS